MSPKRGDQVPQPARGDEWKLVFDTTSAAKGWVELENVARGNLRKAWEIMRHSPNRSDDESRHKRLKHGLTTYPRQGLRLPFWQIEVTSGGRIWYLLDEEKHTVWIIYASPRHPNETDN
ncbi:MAG TPA: hypothetical protein VG247_31720 [Pseudonocardiaceae bacterium]|jgi:hypothetical protein|nr:hypothetical protein [Pseudonocardiaceae bacterium]